MRLCSADSLEARCWSAQKSGLASSSSSWRRRSFSGGTSKVTTGPVELGPDLLELLLQRLFSGLGHGGGMLAPPAEPALDRAQPRQRLRRVALPPAEPHRTREAVRRLLVDRRHDRAVDEQAVGALARELREQILGEPLAARPHGSIETRSPTSNQFSKNMSRPAMMSQRTRWTAKPTTIAMNAPPAIVSACLTPLRTMIERTSATPNAT